MPIKPKHSLKPSAKRFVATKEFTDREEPRYSFRKHVNNIRTAMHEGNSILDVLVYYGVGGIGKTSLLRYLKKELAQDYSTALSFNLDFSSKNNISPARGLLELVNNQQGGKTYKFPHFEIAYSLYFMKRNPDISFNEKKIPFESEFSIVTDLLSNIAGFGLVGSLSNVVNTAYKIYSNLELNKDIKDELLKFEELSASEIEELLPAFFAYDLNEILRKNPIEICCIFIDTYEVIWEDVSNSAKKHQNDEWIRELVSHLENVMFVICGRENIQWSELDADWDEVIDQHLLGELDQKNASDFLINSGIQESEIVSKIVTSSGGHPYHLDLSVDTY